MIRRKSSKGNKPEKTFPLSPFRIPIFRSFWIAALISSIGVWMQSTAVAWVMTSISPSPLVVSLVQAASSLPLFLLAFPAGALADLIDRGKLIVYTHVWMFLMALLIGLLILFGWMTSWALLLLTFTLGVGGALSAPATEAILPQMVSNPEIPKAVALNGAGFDLSRSIGPALGGIIIGAAGAATAFFVDSATYLAVIAVLLAWKRPLKNHDAEPQPLTEAIGAGASYLYRASNIRLVLINVGFFTILASVLLSLLPLLARQELKLGSEGYGLMLGAFGAGSTIGAVILPTVRRRMVMCKLVSLFSALFSATLLALAASSRGIISGALLIVAGASWLVVLATLNSHIQTSIAEWVRGRAMAAYMMVFFGSMSAGAVLWGSIAEWTGIPTAIEYAAIAMVSVVLLNYPLRILAVEEVHSER